MKNQQQQAKGALANYPKLLKEGMPHLQ